VEKAWFENPLFIKERRKRKALNKDKNRRKLKLSEFGFDKKKYYDVVDK